MSPLPIVWYDTRYLSGVEKSGAKSFFHGPFACAWIAWPLLGVSFLHSITKHDGAR